MESCRFECGACRKPKIIVTANGMPRVALSDQIWPQCKSQVKTEDSDDESDHTEHNDEEWELEEGLGDYGEVGDLFANDQGDEERMEREYGPRWINYVGASR